MNNIPDKNSLAIVKIIEKNRPAYVLATNGIMLRCYGITTKLTTKSKEIQKACLEIIDWRYANLTKTSENSLILYRWGMNRFLISFAIVKNYCVENGMLNCLTCFRKVSSPDGELLILDEFFQ